MRSKIETIQNINDVCRIRRLTYTQQFTANVVPIFPAYAIMFSDRSGLSTSKISLLFIICNIAALLAEIPTGVLADRISRRTVLLISALLTGLSFTFWLFLPNFTGYALGFSTWGIGFAMSSGALQAYLYDALSALEQSDAFTKIFTRCRALSYAGMFFGYGLAILIGIDQYVLLLTLSLFASLISATIMLLFPKDQKTASITYERGHLRSALQTVCALPRLGHTVAAIALIGGSVAIMEDYVPLYYSAINVSLGAIPYLLLAGILLGIIATWFAHRFEHRKTSWHVFMTLLACVALFASSFGGQEIAILGMMSFIGILRLTVVLFEASLQHDFKGTSRATLGSLPTFLNEIWGIFLAAIYAVAAQMDDDFSAIRAISVAIAVTALALIVWWKQLVRV